MIKVIATLQREHKQPLFGSPEDTCTTFQVAKNTRSYDKISRKIFYNNQIPYMNKSIQSRKLSSNFRNIDNIENKLTRFSNISRNRTWHVNTGIHFTEHNTLKY